MPVGAAAAVTAGSSIAGGIVQGQAADAANKAAQNASNANLAQAKQVYSDTQGNLQPTINNGQSAQTEEMGLLGLGGNPAAANNAFNTFRNSTNYNFLLDQGLKGVNTANAQSFNSGANEKALLNYGQGMAGNALSGYLGTLGGISQLGAQSAANLGSIGENYVSQSAGFRNNAATAAGSNAISQANAFTGALGGVVGGLNAGMSSFGGGGVIQPNAGAVNTGAYTQQVAPSSFNPNPTDFVSAANMPFMTAQMAG